jgi:hypothetical protein
MFDTALLIASALSVALMVAFSRPAVIKPAMGRHTAVSNGAAGETIAPSFLRSSSC